MKLMLILAGSFAVTSGAEQMAGSSSSRKLHPFPGAPPSTLPCQRVSGNPPEC